MSSRIIFLGNFIFNFGIGIEGNHFATSKLENLYSEHNIWNSEESELNGE
jgi:hypothetical protein